MKSILKIVAICVICAATLMSGCVDPGYGQKSDEPTPDPTVKEKVSYQSPVYKTVYHKDPVYETVKHSDPIYDTVYHKEPVYKTVKHSDPVYETVLSVELRDASALGDEIYRINAVYDLDYSYSGRDTWGNAEYTFIVYYYTAGGNKVYSTYYQIDEWSSYTYNIITGYDTRTEEVLTGYTTWDERVITGYDTRTEEVLTGYTAWTEEVVDHYETLYR